MTAHGPRAVDVAREALGAQPEAANDLLIYAVTGVAINVIDDVYPRDEGIDLLAADQRHQLDRRTAARLLDLVVEALTANPQEPTT